MTIAALPKRLGFFTRLLDQADPAERYRLATAQIIHAERFGFDSAWIAQHHFHEDEGGLPAPFVFLAQVAAKTTRIRLGTGIVTLPLELPIRVAEDSAVLDLMCGGRLEVGIGGGGNLSSYAAFGQNSTERATLLAGHLQVLRDAWAGRPLPGGGDRLYPANPSLVEHVWQAPFTVDGARRAGAPGDGRRGSGAFDRSAASLHPQIDRAGRRGGGARARLGTACCGSPACRVSTEPNGRACCRPSRGRSASRRTSRGWGPAVRGELT